ncbi:unnamed protein product [Ilex paraguariensis]|uniref:P5A-ATPase transmembrane helical hairpin domain-containing protein n=1 Tax=Ilex paraguariensis TaxID=185542 RepID=A0ABC8R4E1_9AQUA
MSGFHVGGKVVDRVDPWRKRHWSYAFIVLDGLIAVNILVFLFTIWSVDFKCIVQYSKVNGIQHADACKITPAKFTGSKEVVQLHCREVEIMYNVNIMDFRSFEGSAHCRYEYLFSFDSTFNNTLMACRWDRLARVVNSAFAHSREGDALSKLVSRYSTGLNQNPLMRDEIDQRRQVIVSSGLEVILEIEFLKPTKAIPMPYLGTLGIMDEGTPCMIPTVNVKTSVPILSALQLVKGVKKGEETL